MDDTTETTESAVEPSTTPIVTRIAYGDAPQQFGDLTTPGGDDLPVVVLIHGGFWRNPFDLSLMEPLAADLARRGYAVWNLEYRRIGDDGGGWPGTLDDVAAGVDHLVEIAERASIDLGAVAVVGHSAGGHLALWAAGRADLPSSAPGGDPAVVPLVAVGQGAVVDLVGAATARLGNGAVEEFLGGDATLEPDRYRWATPSLGAGPTMVSVVGSADDIVPARFSIEPAQPGLIELVEIDGANHFDLIDPTHETWAAVVDQLDEALAHDAS